MKQCCKAHIIPGNCPALICITSLAKMGAVIDFKNKNMKLKGHDVEIKLKSSAKGHLIILFAELDKSAEWSARETVLVAATFADKVLPRFGKTEPYCVNKNAKLNPSTSSPSPSTPYPSPSVLK
eukprot:2636741-Heterocapsa_arctica.AAC.1